MCETIWRTNRAIYRGKMYGTHLTSMKSLQWQSTALNWTTESNFKILAKTSGCMDHIVKEMI